MGTSAVLQSCTWYQALLDRFKIAGQTAEERLEALRQVDAQELHDFAQSKYAMGEWHLVLEKGSHAIWSQHPVTSYQTGKCDPWIESIVSVPISLR